MTPAQIKINQWRNDPASFVREQFGVEPDLWQLEALKAFGDPKQQRICMKAAKGPGKAQPKNLEIDTPSGKMKFGDLAIGDLVFAEDGTKTIIKGVYDRGILPLYRIFFDDGSFTDCCGEHLWKVKGAMERRKKTDWSILTTQDIIDRGVRNKNGKWFGRQFEIPQQGPSQFERSFQPLSPYVLGVWLGDGARNCGRYAGKDIEVENAIKERGYEIGPRSNGIDASIYGIVSHLRKLGVLGLGSHTRFVPKDYKYASIVQRREMLCGLMDTDGCIGNDGHMEFNSTSKRLAEDVVWLSRSLGGVAFIKNTVKKPFYRGKNGEKISGRDCYRVTLKLPFNPFNVKRKSVRWQQPDTKSKQRYLTRYIDRIEKISSQDCVCIEIDHPSACYLTNDFIVTHNTALLAWCVWNFLLTRPHPKVAATSVSSDNLRDNLWAELAKWRNKSPLLSSTFTWRGERITCNDHPETWWASARSWPRTADKQQQADTLAGLHADHILFVLDESGSIPSAVMATAEAALSTGIECRLMQAGNPTDTSGPLYNACTVARSLWTLIEINGDPENPNRSPRISLEWAKEMIRQYGRENPWVMVNVLGQFPPTGMNTLLGPNEVQAAMKRVLKGDMWMFSGKRLGIDIARFGDDKTVIFPRQGLLAMPPIVMRNARSEDIAAKIAFTWEKEEVDDAMIDDTGGWASGVIDLLNRTQYSLTPVNFSSKALDDRYFNRRSEMYFMMAEWIKAGGALPDIPELVEELTIPTYWFEKGKFRLEEKDQIKTRLGRSPDYADALCVTWGMPQAIKGVRLPSKNSVTSAGLPIRDPLGREHVRQEIKGETYNPLGRDYVRGNGR